MAAVLLGGCGFFQKGQLEERKSEEREKTPGEIEAEEVDRYLAELEKLGGAAGELVQAVQELTEFCDANPENVEEMEARVGEMRELKQVFADFSDMGKVPEIFRGAHKRMAEAARNYGELIDTYCDVLLAGIRGEEHSAQEQIQAEWEEQSRIMAEAMEEVREAAGHSSS